jgi:predicted dehydrogenase
MNNQRKLVLAQIGCGYWGPNLLRNFSSVPGCTVKYVVELSGERRRYVAENYPQVRCITDPEQVFADIEVEAVVIATPASSHFSLGMTALERGMHIFVEKPLATQVVEVDQMAAVAAKRDRIVMAGHTFIYNNAVRYVKGLIESGELGEIRDI